MKFLAAAATVAGLTMISRIAGFARDLLMAGVLGASAMADAFFVALKLPNLFRRITAEGAFHVAFIPLFSGRREKHGDEAALAMARNIMGVMLAVLSLATLLVIAAMPGVISLIAPGFVDEAERFDMAVSLARVTFPYLMLISLSALIGGVMNVYGRFALYAFLPILFNAGLIAALLFYAVFGVEPVVALAWAVTLSGLVQLIWIGVAAAMKGQVLIPTWPRLTPEVKRLWQLMLPAIFGAGVMHINILADMVIASLLPAGSISHLYFADRLNQLPIGVIGVAIGTALLPMLSKAVAAGQGAEAARLYRQSLSYSLMATLPAAVALVVAAPLLVTSLFQHGAFTADDAAIAARVLQAYACGLPAYIMAKTYQGIFFAHQDTKTPVKISMIITAINIILSLILIRYIGVVGIAASTAFVGWVQVILLRRAVQDKGVESDRNLAGLIIRMVIAALVMGGCVYAVGLGVSDMVDGAIHQRALACFALVAGGMVVYATGLRVIARVKITDIVKDIKG